MTRPRRNALLLTAAIAAIALAAIAVGSRHADGPSKAALAVTQPEALAPGRSGEFGLIAHKTPRPVPLLTFVNGDNRPMTLADFHGAVLLNVWATWCVPCRKELPTLDRLQAKLGGRDFQVVALSVDRLGLKAVAPLYRQLGIKSLAIYLDTSSRAATAIDTAGLPTTLLIDREGREVARKVGAAEWDDPAMIARIRDLLRRDADTPSTTK